MSFNNITTFAINVQSQFITQYLGLTLGFFLLISDIMGDCLKILVFVIIAMRMKAKWWYRAECG
jgi:hypothetical protein